MSYFLAPFEISASWWQISVKDDHFRLVILFYSCAAVLVIPTLNGVWDILILLSEVLVSQTLTSDVVFLHYSS